jgi:hypothetical protein
MFLFCDSDPKKGHFMIRLKPVRLPVLGLYSISFFTQLFYPMILEDEHESEKAVLSICPIGAERFFKIVFCHAFKNKAISISKCRYDHG